MPERTVCGWELRGTAPVDYEIGVPAQVVAQRSVGRQSVDQGQMVGRCDSISLRPPRVERSLDGNCGVLRGFLLEAGFADEAYARYAVEATYATTNWATFKAIVTKYPGKPRETILRDLATSQPGNDGLQIGVRAPADAHTRCTERRGGAARVRIGCWRLGRICESGQGWCAGVDSGEPWR